MGSALEEFRAQREAVEAVHARLTEVAELLRSLRQTTTELAQDQNLRKLLNEEQTWLLRAEDVMTKARQIREWEANRFWPAVWRRWAMVLVLALATAIAAGAGYVWAGQPYDEELSNLRGRVDLGDAVARRVLQMTPAEHRQFDVLMKWTEPQKR
jgi:hypothetical protein